MYSEDENESLQQITGGLDPRTNLGMLTGAIGEVLVFDRLLEPYEEKWWRDIWLINGVCWMISPNLALRWARIGPVLPIQ